MTTSSVRFSSLTAKGETPMNDFVIFTDSACDIYPEVLAEWGIKTSI